MSVDSFLRFAEDFRLVVDPDRYRLLSSRRGATFRVAVIGLVSRGKSTLVNRIIGLALCPVDARAETVANVFIVSGPPSATASADGVAVPISSDPGAFAERLPRRVTPSVTHAEFSGATRLPPGLTLVDTPGLGDAAIESEDLAYLDQHWLDTGATAAVLVLSYPPGFSRSDRRLLDAAQRVFGSALTVVLKATDSEVELDELRQVVEAVHEETGVSPVLLGDSPPTGPWGIGDLADLEQRLLWLSGQASDLMERDAEELADVHALAAFALRNRSMDDLTRLETLPVTYPGLPNDVLAAARARAEELKLQQYEEARAAKEVERARRAAVLDRQATELVGLLSGRHRSSATSRSTGKVLNELLQLVGEGSVVAREALRGQLAGDRARRRELGVNVASLVRSSDIEHWLPLVTAMQLEHNEVLAVLGASWPREHEESLFKAVAAYCTSPLTDSRSIEELAHKCGAADRRLVIESHYRSKVLDELRDSIRRCNTVSAGRSLLVELTRAERPLQRGAFAAPLTNDGREWFAAGLATMRKAARARIVWVLECEQTKAVTGAVSVTVEHARSIANESQELAHWAARLDDPASVRLARLFTVGGELELWAARCEGAQAQARRRTASIENFWSATYVLSFILWGVSVLMLLEQSETSLVVWLVSFVMWLVSRSAVDGVGQWQRRFVTPRFPPWLEEL